jgi:VWFA-related protein
MRARCSWWICLAVPLVTIAQTTPSLRTGTQIVMVDVIVTDGHDNPVRNLQQRDFRVYENGSEQAVSLFEEHSAAAAATPAAMPKLAPNVYTNFPTAAGGGPENLLLFDLLNTPVDRQAYARGQLLAFLKTMKPGTRVALFTLTSRLNLLQGFTADPALLVAAVNALEIHSSPILADPMGSMGFADSVAEMPMAKPAIARQNEIEQSTEQNHFRAVYTLGAMSQLAHYLSGTAGRKNLIWFSNSFPAGLFNSIGSLQTDFRKTMNLLARSQVAVYPVGLRGLANTPLSDVSATKYALNGGKAVNDDSDQFGGLVRDERATNDRMAKATGGKAFDNGNDLAQAVTQALADGSHYYTLVYSPSDKREDGSYRKISVVAGGGYRLAYRDGYYADSLDGQPVSREAGKDAQVRKQGSGDTAPPDVMRAAMQRGAPAPSEIIFNAMVVANPATSDKLAAGNKSSPKSKPPYRVLTVAYAVNPGDITMPERPDGTRQVDLDFVSLVYDREGQLFTQQSDQVNVFAKQAAIQQVLKEGVRYQQQIAVPAKGEYYLRIGIHDLIGDKVGVIEIPVGSVAVMAIQSTSPAAK